MIMKKSLTRTRFLVGFLVWLSLISTVSWAEAGVWLPALYSDNMVIQKGVPFRFWGKADAGERLTIEASWLTEKHAVETGSDGKWKAELPSPLEKGPHRLTVSGKNAVTIQNILCGEVWVCAGQSNMQMPMQKMDDRADRGVLNYEEEIAKANDPEIRLFFVDRSKLASSEAPLDDLPGMWKVCSPQTVGSFSAVGYFFGEKLHGGLQSPVGLINVSIGGTYIESWMSRKVLESDPDFAPHLQWYQQGMAKYPAELAAYEKATEEWKKQGSVPSKQPAPPYWYHPERHRNVPGGLYNSMIMPLSGYNFRGVIWYQGEANADKGGLYRKLLTALISDWRSTWNNKDLSFLFVQLTGFETPTVYGPFGWVDLRESQFVVCKTVPNTGMAVTIDVGENHIHPRNKRPVGERLALLALNQCYGQNIESSGPLYRSHVFEGSKAIVQFDHTGKGLCARGGMPLRGFVVAGGDRKFVPAEATISNNMVVVQSERVAAPVALRYAWAFFPICNLFNEDGLPAAPFRTDDWRPDVSNRADAKTLLLRNGLDEYRGCADAVITSDKPDEVYFRPDATLPIFLRKVVPTLSRLGLLRWNLEVDKLKGREISAAKLILHIQGNYDKKYSHNQRLGFLTLKRAWKSDEVTWREASSGNKWTAEGAQGDEDVVTVYPGAVEVEFEFDAENAHGCRVECPLSLEMVKGWQANPSSNFGVLVKFADQRSDSALFLYSNGTPPVDQELRPALELKLK